MRDRSASERRRRLLVLAALMAAAAVALLPAIPQPAQYHRFADQRAFLGVPHFLNVASNLPLLLVGIAGLAALRGGTRTDTTFPSRVGRRLAQAFFAGVAFTAVASAWYHLAPNDARLLADRLAMGTVFATFLAAQLGERLGARVGAVAVAPLAAAAALGAVSWYASEAAGASDLRPWILVQACSFLAIALLAALFPARRATRAADVFAVLGLYGLALIAEWLDGPIYALGEIVSGHTFKHLLAAAAAGWWLRALRSRVVPRVGP